MQVTATFDLLFSAPFSWAASQWDWFSVSLPLLAREKYAPSQCCWRPAVLCTAAMLCSMMLTRNQGTHDTVDISAAVFSAAALLAQQLAFSLLYQLYTCCWPRTSSK
ncbi:hypothetical protein COO60DRAFT_1703733 [Scenedesmus sp. NREL 46B-D3]|nr:hypothetical protein COO60DRAFT_1703733 [Scenedesmus sp. NREL 46B-D3]